LQNVCKELKSTILHKGLSRILQSLTAVTELCKELKLGGLLTAVSD